MSILEKLDPKPYGYGTFMEGDFIGCASWAIKFLQWVVNNIWGPEETPGQILAEEIRQECNGLTDEQRRELDKEVPTLFGQEQPARGGE